MLNKNEIIEGLQSKEFFIKNGIYEYICNLHLYDDEEINEALINYIKQNYKQINFTGLRLSKLNKNIIDCLIDIYLSEKDLKYKERIESIRESDIKMKVRSGITIEPEEEYILEKNSKKKNKTKKKTNRKK